MKVFQISTPSRGFPSQVVLTLKVRVMGFNAIFNNISVILWRSVLLVEETGENH
jgi:hypothetical protein